MDDPNTSLLGANSRDDGTLGVLLARTMAFRTHTPYASQGNRQVSTARHLRALHENDVRKLWKERGWWWDLLIFLIGVAFGCLMLWSCLFLADNGHRHEIQPADDLTLAGEPNGLDTYIDPITHVVECGAVTTARKSAEAATPESHGHWRPALRPGKTGAAMDPGVFDPPGPAQVAGINDPPGPSNWHVSSAQASRYAFVLMAHDAPDALPHYIWQAITIARALQRLSRYPTLVLTNTTHLPDGTSVAGTFWRLNAQVIPVHPILLPDKVEKKMMPVWQTAFWKLQIWRLTQFDKLIWLDTDGIVYRNMDHIFNWKPIWGQRDAWVCSDDKEIQNWLCSGFMLIEPSEDTYHQLIEYAERPDNRWWENGDQKLISDYFHYVGQPVRLLPITEAAFGKCLSTIPSLFDNETSSMVSAWELPAYVHKSSTKNECFSFDMLQQLQLVEGTLVNICHYHPLGRYWRDLFCEAVQIIGVKTLNTNVYCDDYQWYRHR